MHKKSRTDRVAVEMLEQRNGDLTVTGEVLEILPLRCEDDADNSSWAWSLNYLTSTGKSKTSTSKLTVKHSSFSFPAWLIIPLCPALCDSSPVKSLATGGDRGRTWAERAELGRAGRRLAESSTIVDYKNKLLRSPVVRKKLNLTKSPESIRWGHAPTQSGCPINLTDFFFFSLSPFCTSTTSIVAGNHGPPTTFSPSDPSILPRFQDVHTRSTPSTTTPGARHQWNALSQVLGPLFLAHFHL